MRRLPFVTSSVHSACCPQGSSTLGHGLELPSLVRLNNNSDMCEERECLDQVHEQLKHHSQRQEGASRSGDPELHQESRLGAQDQQSQVRALPIVREAAGLLRQVEGSTISQNCEMAKACAAGPGQPKRCEGRWHFLSYGTGTVRAVLTWLG